MVIKGTKWQRIIELLYLLYYRRNPDPEGLDHWTQRFSSGEIKSVLKDFVNSEEAVKLYGKEKVYKVLSILENKYITNGTLKLIVNLLYGVSPVIFKTRKLKEDLKILLGWILVHLTGKILSINLFERKIYSQNGEDGILEAIFKKIKFTNGYCVEIGTGDGRECNCRYLIEKYNLKYLLIDSGTYEKTYLDIKREFVTAENINEILEKYQVPYEFDLLSIDIDYNTFWIWHALKPRFRPRVVVVEYNSLLPPELSRVVKYDPYGVWEGDDYFGASLSAFVKLGKEKGYCLVGCESNGVNAFFVQEDIAKKHFILRDYRKLYRRYRYQYPKSNKEFVEY